jgi:tRNA dimethylallyltransferase
MEPGDRPLEAAVLTELAGKPRDGSAEHPFLILAGPTGVGKTDLSLELARLMNAEIISADSRQVFRHLDIGTAKAGLSERREVPHHFIDELDPTDDFSAGLFAERAVERIDCILSRGRQPLVTGGSTLYVHGLQEGFSEVPGVDRQVRLAVEAELAERGALALYAELEQVDPAAAATMDPTKTHRLVRALEVFRATGTPLSTFHTRRQPRRYHFETFVLLRDRAALYERIDRRVDVMLEAGLLREVHTVVNILNIPASANPLRTIGYAEPIAFLQGEISFEEMRRLMQRNTRRYAKRQMTWFRRYPALILS